MTKNIKTCLVLLLITSLALLPMRAAFAMSTMNTTTVADTTTTTSDHCKNMKMDMSSNITTNSDQSNTNNNGSCCDKANSDCNHCTSHISMIESETIKTINQTPDTFYRFSLTTVQTQEFTPPFKPPLFRFI